VVSALGHPPATRGDRGRGLIDGCRSVRVAAEKLESATDLNQLEARGTLRLALKSAGLTAGNLTLAQFRVVFDKLMPGELESSGVADTTATCTAVMAEVERSAPDSGDAETTEPDMIFRRLGSA
jgi:hypothetical protein